MEQKVRVVPAILTDDQIALGKMVLQAETFTDYAQFDVMDGVFVPSRSVSCEQIAGVQTRLTWEAHLMVARPEACLEDFKKAGARRIVFHFEATRFPDHIVDSIRKLGIEAGLAVNPETPVDALAPLAKTVDSVLFLSVHPGFYGAKFIPEVLDKVRDFRRRYPRTEAGIDGGVKEDNIADIAATGANVIYVGSAIFLQPDPAESYRRLCRLAEAYAP
jgi:ribulose-phosphate 3-epimerase